MSNNNVTLHRVLTATPEKIYRAFSDPHAFASWLPPYGFFAIVHQLDFREGGIYRMSFTNFSTGNQHSFGGRYVTLKPNAFLQYTDRFEDPSLPDEMTTTVRLKEISCGTELKIVQEGMPSIIPAEMCYLGWQDSLDKLKKLAEPEIPDA